MGFFDGLLKIFGKKAQSEALQSDVKAMEQRFKAMEALQSTQYNKEISSETQIPESSVSTTEPTIGLEKNSLQLGIAAGYTGKSLRSIENSLVRIESQLPTKDWFELTFGQSIREVVDVLKQHEQEEQLRFETIQNSLDSMRTIARTAPQPIRSELHKQIDIAESHLPLTPRMKEILGIVKESTEISYEDLAKRLNLNEVSALRALLSNMIKRTNDIERFEKDGKGWLHYTGKSALNRSQSDGTAL